MNMRTLTRRVLRHHLGLAGMREAYKIELEDDAHVPREERYRERNAVVRDSLPGLTPEGEAHRRFELTRHGRAIP